MNRLVLRLSLAMILVAILTAIIIVATQQIGFELDFRSLPPEVQDRILERRAREETARNDLAANFRRTRQIQEQAIIIGTTIASLIAATIAIFYARSISRPIESVSRASAKLAKGDLAARISQRSAYSSQEAKALTDNFNQMAVALESYETERRDMIASIAHDLRTPLTALKLRLEALKEELVPLNQDEVSLLLSQTDLLERLITDLRTLSLADTGKLTITKQKTNLNELFGSIVNSYDPMTETKQIKINVMAEETMSAYIDPTRLKQIVSNLLDNALRVSPDKSSIDIDVSLNQKELIISVSDEGPGIPEKLLPIIFERYIKDKDTGGSSGLGLAIVHTLVTLHEGKIKASNPIDGGALFEIILPAGSAHI